MLNQSYNFVYLNIALILIYAAWERLSSVTISASACEYIYKYYAEYTLLRCLYKIKDTVPIDKVVKLIKLVSDIS